MAYFMNAIAFLVMAVGSFVRGQEEVAVGKYDNIEPFSFLCRVYNVAKNPPINYVDLQEPVELVNEIDSLNVSLGKGIILNETEHVVNNSEAQVKQTVTREAALAQLSLNQVTQRAYKILEDIKRMKIAETIEKAKAKFNQIIFGENGNESDLGQNAFTGVIGRADACGNPGEEKKGESAGKNLVLDFFCLCTQRPDGSEGAKQVCGFYVGSNYPNGQIGWNETSLLSSSTMWASIKGGCGKHMQQQPKSTAEARHIIGQFVKHLKTGGVYRQIVCKTPPNNCKDVIVEGSHRKAGMLGTGVTVDSTAKVTCDGKNGGKKNNKVNPGGVCVYYGQESDWETNVYWLKQFRAALATTDAVNNKTATIRRKIKKIQMLQHRAEEIYETAKVMLEIQYPVGLSAVLKNASGNLTAYNVTRTRSYSHNPNPYFIPLWVFLL